MNEIDEFLKRAAAMRARQKAAEPAAPRPTAPQAAPTPAPQSRPTPLAPLSSRSSLDVVQDAEVVEEEVSGDDVAQYVAQHLDSGAFRDRSRQLGRTIKSSDEAIEQHLHQTFEHRLGQLGGMTARAEDSTLDAEEAAAARQAKALESPVGIRSLLRSPQTLRNAIILSEVLNPPTHRW